MLKLNKDTGKILGELQRVPYEFDDDRDWAAGATAMNTSCAELITSVQKDGWSYATDPAHLGACKWQFPPTLLPIYTRK